MCRRCARVIVIDPEEGALASGRWGAGRLAEEAHSGGCPPALTPRRDWEGQRLAALRGATQEPTIPSAISKPLPGKSVMPSRSSLHARGAGGAISGPTFLPRRGEWKWSVETAGNGKHEH
jgi:hypothetical protein